MIHLSITQTQHRPIPHPWWLLLWVMLLGSSLNACGHEPYPVGADLGRGGMVFEIDLPPNDKGTIERLSVYKETRGIDVLRGPQHVKQPNGERSTFYHVWLRSEEWQPVDAYLTAWCSVPPATSSITPIPGEYQLAFQCPAPQRSRHFSLPASQLPQAFQVLIRATYDTRRFTK